MNRPLEKFYPNSYIININPIRKFLIDFTFFTFQLQLFAIYILTIKRLRRLILLLYLYRESNTTIALCVVHGARTVEVKLIMMNARKLCVQLILHYALYMLST